MNIKTYVIPEKSEKYLIQFEFLIRKFEGKFSQEFTKDGFVYEIEFFSNEKMNDFSEDVFRQIPNLY